MLARMRKRLLSAHQVVPSCKFLDQRDSSVDASTYAFPGIPLGAPKATRLNVIGVTGRGNASSSDRHVTSLSINGVPGDLIISRVAPNNRFVSELWQVPERYNQLGEINVDFNGTLSSVSIATWAIYDLASQVPTAANQNIDSATTIDISAFGIVIASVFTAGGAQSLTGVIQEFNDTTFGDVASLGQAGGSRQAIAAETGTAVASSGPNEYVVVGSWR